ncbi:DMT family transporter [Tranquillimonas rosea]|uniref:DMT family transporter n=1 Tax=Tranquillimonas rosea TaxID=641238 RepID=UPI003BAB0690
MRPGLAIALKLVSVTLFVGMQAIVKAASEVVPAGQAVFFRSFFAIPVILVWLAATGHLRTGLKTAYPVGHAWRGTVGSMAMGLMFAGLAYLPLAEVQAINYAAPLLVVVFAALFLGERLRWFRITAVAMGLTGVLIVLSGRLTMLDEGEAGARAALGAMLVLGSATCAALAQIQIRRMVSSGETISSVVFWFSVTASVLSLVSAPFFPWTYPGVGMTALLVVAGLIGGVGQICLTSAYRYGDASLVAPIDYASIILAVAIGYVVFAELPTPRMYAGVALVVAAGGLIIWRERKLGIERGRARRGMTPPG